MTYESTEVDEPTGWRGFLVPLGVVIGLAGLIIGIWFLIDLHDPASTRQLHTQPVVATRIRIGGIRAQIEFVQFLLEYIHRAETGDDHGALLRVQIHDTDTNDVVCDCHTDFGDVDPICPQFIQRFDDPAWKAQGDD